MPLDNGVKLKAIVAMVEVLMPVLDVENRTRVIQWAQDNFEEMRRASGQR